MGQGQPVSVAALFRYLLLGTEAALLPDTGATAAEPIADPANRR